MIAARILNKIEWYADRREPLRFAKHLRDRPSGATHRFRIGEYRVLIAAMSAESPIIRILTIRHRREAYRL